MHCSSGPFTAMSNVSLDYMFCVFRVLTEGSEELAGSQPLSQFKASSIPSSIRAHAVITLGMTSPQSSFLEMNVFLAETLSRNNP